MKSTPDQPSLESCGRCGPGDAQGRAPPAWEINRGWVWISLISAGDEKISDGTSVFEQEFGERTRLVGTLITRQIFTVGVYARGTNEEKIFKCSAG